MTYIEKFADDSKIERPLISDSDSEVPQKERNVPYEWVNEWMIHFYSNTAMLEEINAQTVMYKVSMFLTTLAARGI